MTGGTETGSGAICGEPDGSQKCGPSPAGTGMQPGCSSQARNQPGRCSEGETGSFNDGCHLKLQKSACSTLQGKATFHENQATCLKSDSVTEAHHTVGLTSVSCPHSQARRAWVYEPDPGPWGGPPPRWPPGLGGRCRTHTHTHTHTHPHTHTHGSSQPLPNIPGDHPRPPHIPTCVHPHVHTGTWTHTPPRGLALSP